MMMTHPTSADQVTTGGAGFVRCGLPRPCASPLRVRVGWFESGSRTTRARSHHARHHPPAHRIPRPLRASLRSILPRRVPRRWNQRGFSRGGVHCLLGLLERQPVPGREVLQLRVMCVRVRFALSMMPVPSALASSRPKPHAASRPPLPLPRACFSSRKFFFFPPSPRSHLTFACSVRVTR